jgi:hypothetical protein
MVWVSLTHVTDADTFIREYRDFHKLAEDRGIAVAIGGRGFNDTLRMKVPYTTYGDGMVHLASFARTLYRRPGRPKRGRPPGGGKSDSPGDLLA